MLNAILEIDGRKIPVVVKTVDRRYGEAMEITVMANVNFNVLESRVKTDIERVIFKNPATVVFWKDGTKTVVKCQPGDIYSEETGLALCIAKKYLGNKSNFNNVFKKWIPEKLSVEEMRTRLLEYCRTKHLCLECVLNLPECRCGNGVSFLTKTDGAYDMSDEEIIKAYKKVFEK